MPPTPRSSPSTSSTTSCRAARSAWPAATPSSRRSSPPRATSRSSSRRATPTRGALLVRRAGRHLAAALRRGHARRRAAPGIAALPGPVIDKATTLDADAYSGFDATGLAALLRDAGITHVLVGGLATDYCVKATVLDALSAGFDVTVLADAVAAVDVEPGDGARALEEMAPPGRTCTRGWGREDSNLRLTDYESAALTN